MAKTADKDKKSISNKTENGGKKNSKIVVESNNTFSNWSSWRLKTSLSRTARFSSGYNYESRGDECSKRGGKTSKSVSHYNRGG